MCRIKALDNGYSIFRYEFDSAKMNAPVLDSQTQDFSEIDASLGRLVALETNSFLI